MLTKNSDYGNISAKVGPACNANQHIFRN